MKCCCGKASVLLSQIEWYWHFKSLYSLHHDLIKRYGIYVADDNKYVPYVVITIPSFFPRPWHRRLNVSYITKVTVHLFIFVRLFDRLLYHEYAIHSQNGGRFLVLFIKSPNISTNIIIKTTQNLHLTFNILLCFLLP